MNYGAFLVVISPHPDSRNIEIMTIFGTTYYITELGIFSLVVILMPFVGLLLWILFKDILRRSFSVRKLGILTGLIVAVSAITLWDVVQTGRQVTRLCSEEGGLHVYKTAEAEGFLGAYSIEFWSKYGFKYVEREIDATHEKYYRTYENGKIVSNNVDKFISQYELAEEIRIINKHVKQWRTMVRVRRTEEVLGELIIFSIYPGWFDSFLFSITPMEFNPWRCGDRLPPESNEVQLTYVDIVKATLKPKSN